MELKPCPFCGSFNVKMREYMGATRVACYECFAQGPDFDSKYTSYGGQKAPERAALAWNERN